MSPHISYPHLKSNGSCITSNNYYKSKQHFKQNNRIIFDMNNSNRSKKNYQNRWKKMCLIMYMQILLFDENNIVKSQRVKRSWDGP